VCCYRVYDCVFVIVCVCVCVFVCVCVCVYTHFESLCECVISHLHRYYVIMYLYGDMYVNVHYIF